MTEKKNIRLVDIAHMANVSVGTVDRVIHNRGRVSEENIVKIKKIMTELGYKPNILARSLSINKTYNIVAIIPEYKEGNYWQSISYGINKAVEDTRDYGINVHFITFNQYQESSFSQVVEKIIASVEDIDGIILATLFTEKVINLSRYLDQQHIPYIYVDSDIDSQNRLAYYGTDSLAGGSICSRLLWPSIRPTDDIIVASIKHNSNKNSNQIEKRMKGFINFLEKKNFRGHTIELDLRYNDDRYNYETLDKTLAENHNIKGAVTFNSSCFIIGNYLKSRQISDITLIGYDLIDKNEQLLNEGYVKALITQRPEVQGYSSVKALGAYLLYNNIPQTVNLLPIDILIKENVQFYNKLSNLLIV